MYTPFQWGLQWVPAPNGEFCFIIAYFVRIVYNQFVMDVWVVKMLRKDKNVKLMNNYTDVNAKAIDNWVAAGWEWGVPISMETFRKACAGEWNVVLTPQVGVPHTWFAPFLKDGRLEGVKILGLASGGAQQMPVFAALGAQVTVLDYSESQLESEHSFAAQAGYEIEIVRADMTKPFPFAPEQFDLIFHPVSNCYIEDVCHVWLECHRVLREGGVLLAGMDNGLSYLVDETETEPLVLSNKLPFHPLKNPVHMEKTMADGGSVQFSHSMEEQIGGQLQAGLLLTNLLEDRDCGGLLAQYAPQYLLTRAIKRNDLQFPVNS